MIYPNTRNHFDPRVRQRIEKRIAKLRGPKRRKLQFAFDERSVIPLESLPADAPHCPSQCRHCDCFTMTFSCYRCKGARIHDECETCHNELAHGIIRNQNIHFCSSPDRPQNSAERDIDAFARADQ